LKLNFYHAAMSQADSLDTIIRSVPSASLIHLAENDPNLTFAVKTLKAEKKSKELTKGDARKLIQGEIKRISSKILVEKMSLKQLAEAVGKLNINHEEQGNHPNSSRVHKKRLLEALQGGVPAFLEEHLEINELVEIANIFGIQANSEDSEPRELISTIVRQIEYEACYTFLASLSREVLLDVAYEMKLLQATQTAAVGTVAKAILTRQEVDKVKKPAPKKHKVKLSKTKPAIERGIDYDNLYAWYTVEELRDFVKENELLVSGTKKELVKRILAWLDGDKENTTREGKAAKTSSKAKPEKKISKKSEGQTAKKSEDEETVKQSKSEKTTKKPEKEIAKPSKPSKSEEKTTQKSDDKVSKPENKVIEAPKEEEDDEEVLDLDNLENYSLSTLKEYCVAEGINIKGKSKQSYIDAILKYNEDLEE